MEKVEKTEDEWRELLTPEQYAITREAGTERPFTGKYVDTKDDGTYCCVACGNELFSSDTKFDSGTGWPSFWEPMESDAGRAPSRQQSLHAPHRGTLRALRIAPGSRLRGRTQPDGSAVLHQLLCPGARLRLRGHSKLLTRRGTRRRCGNGTPPLGPARTRWPGQLGVLVGSRAEGTHRLLRPRSDRAASGGPNRTTVECLAREAPDGAPRGAASAPARGCPATGPALSGRPSPASPGRRSRPGPGGSRSSRRSPGGSR